MLVKNTRSEISLRVCFMLVCKNYVQIISFDK